jgi:hypothetical protein
LHADGAKARTPSEIISIFGRIRLGLGLAKGDGMNLPTQSPQPESTPIFVKIDAEAAPFSARAREARQLARAEMADEVSNIRRRIAFEIAAVAEARHAELEAARQASRRSTWRAVAIALMASLAVIGGVVAVVARPMPAVEIAPQRPEVATPAMVELQPEIEATATPAPAPVSSSRTIAKHTRRAEKPRQARTTPRCGDSNDPLDPCL